MFPETPGGTDSGPNPVSRLDPASIIPAMCAVAGDEDVGAPDGPVDHQSGKAA